MLLEELRASLQQAQEELAGSLSAAKASTVEMQLAAIQKQSELHQLQFLYRQDAGRWAFWLPSHLTAVLYALTISYINAGT